ncbi:SDR family NAD(P)-dependent oxidoreductase [Conexibacter sp. CPCC 206217]|uniref:SDR family NAD(P)-dependent oxidoreductase n=1 Tax=Conexibacter sp. CPCC 206217 TaxID=3064574 RepID=UPI002728594C|nr:SDR family oxidoreductase [Conexibacter sp. CPCC 206217]MDO8209026.1 SDR family oxidoreductase [Conexibacter sp. CPCC 206217]
MPDVQDLTAKTVLLTGASGGIGSATASALLERGAHLIAHYSSDRDGAERACAQAPERVLLVQQDLSRAGASRRLWQEAVAWRDRVDVVVLNAAVSVQTPLDGGDEEWDAGWDRTLRVNVLEPASLMREAVNHYRQHGGGALITLSSWAAQRGSAIPQLGAYAASKAAVQALAQTIARNHAREGIFSYVVAPGIVQTPMSEISAIHRGGVDAVNAALAMGEMAQPDEVGRLIAFLASGAVKNLTGATLDVNGASNIR